MDEYLDIGAESFNGVDSFDDDDAGDDAIGVGAVPEAVGGDDAHIWSPSSSERR